MSKCDFAEIFDDGKETRYAPTAVVLYWAVSLLRKKELDDEVSSNS